MTEALERFIRDLYDVQDAHVVKTLTAFARLVREEAASSYREKVDYEIGQAFNSLVKRFGLEGK